MSRNVGWGEISDTNILTSNKMKLHIHIMKGSWCSTPAQLFGSSNPTCSSRNRTHEVKIGNERSLVTRMKKSVLF